MARELEPAPIEGIAFRPGTEADLLACEDVWRVGLDGYLGPLGFPELPIENPGLRRLHAHTLATDASRFWVATEPRPDGDRVVGFGSAVLRGRVWFLSMLFVYPEAQARGIGRALLERILPSAGEATALSTVTDAAQPVSNGLYASLGIVPRMPLFNLVGRPRDGWQPPAMPDGIRVVQIHAGDAGSLEFARDRDALDRAVLGFDHPVDHAYVTTGEGRFTFAYVDRGGLVGYGNAALAGRVGPLAVRDPGLVGPVLGHLLTAVEPRGASAAWLPGASDGAMPIALEAGLRIEGFPVILCWSAPFGDFSRYVPISPGLL